jgi:hypothetical protein
MREDVRITLWIVPFALTAVLFWELLKWLFGL